MRPWCRPRERKMGATSRLEPHRRPPEPIDRGERVIRTPDTSQVPADIAPRQPRDIQISVDPTQRRREGRETPQPVRRYHPR